jgi:hypothetical protein
MPGMRHSHPHKAKAMLEELRLHSFLLLLRHTADSNGRDTSACIATEQNIRESLQSRAVCAQTH